MAPDVFGIKPAVAQGLGSLKIGTATINALKDVDRSYPNEVRGACLICDNNVNSCKDNWAAIQEDLDGIMKDEGIEDIDKRLAEIDLSGVSDPPPSDAEVRAWKIAEQKLKDKKSRLLTERNQRITEEYKKVAANNPENRWAKLASYASAQVGCGIQETKGAESQALGIFPPYLINPDEAEAALSEGNKTIFSSVGQPFMFIDKFGYEQFDKCASEKNTPVPKEIVEAARLMDEGGEDNLKEASDKIAKYEQHKVVQPVYEKYADVFEKIDWADTHEPLWGSRDRQSMALEHACDTGEKIPLGDLELKNPKDRVEYYKQLMKELDKKDHYDYSQ